LLATSLPSSGSASSDQADVKFRPALIARPTNNRKDYCTYPGLNYQGGDLPDSQVTNSNAFLKSDEANLSY